MNSQNVPLLTSVLNPNPPAGTGGGGITINQGALVPDMGPLGSVADIGDTLSPDRISLYVVREGDNISEIAEMFGVSVNTIFWANDLSRRDLIKIGQALVILPVTGLSYTVKEGDTIPVIAKKYDADMQEIIAFNGLPSDGSLTVGQEIIIPDGQKGEIIAPSSSSVSSSKIVRGGGPDYGGYYLRPIDGGKRSQGLHGYNAVDLATYCGAPIYAAATGDVIIERSSGWNSGYGRYIVIAHSNGTQTLYAHTSGNIVTVGWHVVRGQIIGYIGTTGKSTGCHVHFEVRGAKNPF